MFMRRRCGDEEGTCEVAFSIIKMSNLVKWVAAFRNVSRWVNLGEYLSKEITAYLLNVCRRRIDSGFRALHV